MITFYIEFQQLKYNVPNLIANSIFYRISLKLGKIEASHYVFSMASGYILYIALADMIPELNAKAIKSSKKSVLKGLKVLFLQNLGLILGMSLIYLMTLYEDYFTL